MKLRSANYGLWNWRLAVVAGLLVASAGRVRGADAGSTNLHVIDLPTALRLAGADNLEVRLAQERVAGAEALQDQARAKFFPWIQPAVGYRRHEGNIQDTTGVIFDASRQSYTAGAALIAQVDFGDAIYSSLAAKQRVIAARQESEAQRQQSMAEAAAGYVELARAQGAVEVAGEALRIAADYANQVTQAVEAGIAFKGDQFRAGGRVQQNRQLQTRAQADRRVAAARLAQVLRLDPGTDLEPAAADLAPLTLVDANAALSTLISRALSARPELRGVEADIAAASAERKGATVGPLIPTLGASANFYGLGGGRNDDWGNFGGGQDYFVGLSWRIGSGGLFDRGRKREASSKERQVTLEQQRWVDQVTREVVESYTRARSFEQQWEMSRSALDAAVETLRLSRERRDFGVGMVLETLQAEQDLTRARLDYLGLIAAANRAGFELQRAIGAPIELARPSTP